VPDEETMASLPANLIISLQSSADIYNSLPSRPVNWNGGLKSMASLANEICGECVPRNYARIHG